MRTLFLPLAALLVVACSGSGTTSGTDDTGASSALTEEKELTLENVYLGHADVRDWEPGDARFYFPVAAEIFYGFRELEGYRIDRGDDCAKFDVKESVDPSAPAAARADATKYEIACTAKDGSASRVVARSDRNWSQEESEGIVLGTSLKFEPNVKLTKIGPKHYKLETGR